MTGPSPAALPAGWAVAVEDYTNWCVIAGHSSGTLRIRRHYLARLGQVHPDPWQLRLDDLVAFLSSSPQWRPQTRKAARAAVRSFYAWAATVGRVAVDPARALPAVRVPAGQPRPTPAIVAAAAVERAPCDRDRLMVLLALHAGLRRAEIARVHTRDVVDGRLRVQGKGGKVRIVPLSAELVDALATVPTGYAFPGKDAGHLSPDRVGRVVTRLLGDGWTTHTLRHRFGTDTYAVERDLLAVQKLLGHAKPETTAVYAEVPVEAMTRAVEAAAATRRWHPISSPHAGQGPGSQRVRVVRKAAGASALDEVSSDAVERVRAAVHVDRAATRAAVETAPSLVRAALWLYASGLPGRAIASLEWSQLDLDNRCVMTTTGVRRLTAEAADAMRKAIGAEHQVSWSSKSDPATIVVTTDAQHVFATWNDLYGRWSRGFFLVGRACKAWLKDQSLSARLTDLPALLVGN